MTGPGSATCLQDGWGRENPTQTAPGEALTKRHRTGVQFPPSPPEGPRIPVIRGLFLCPNTPRTPFTHGVGERGLATLSWPLYTVGTELYWTGTEPYSIGKEPGL